MYRLFLIIILIVPLSVPAYDSQQMLSSSLDKKIQTTLLTDSVAIPWAMVQLPSGDIIYSERSGQLKAISKDLKIKTIKGLPPIKAKGQGGLLDLTLHPNFAENHWLYFSYSSEAGEGSGSNTAIMRAKLSLETYSLSEQQRLYKGSPNSKSGRHFGSRIVFDRQGMLYFSIGDRGDRDTLPQDLSKDGGKIYRLHDDGTLPTDNPFYGQKHLKQAIFSYGHRNPQGLSIDESTGLIWSHEHGPRGGDEVNVISKGENYGWPIVSYGINYDGSQLTDKTHLSGMKQPALYWDPSIAPSDMLYITSHKYPNLKGKFLLGSMKFNHLVLLTTQDNYVVKQEKLFADIGRVRSMMQGTDGYIYVGLDSKGIIKLVPSK